MKFSLTAGFGLLLALLATNCILTYRAVSMLQHDQESIAKFQGIRIELGAILNDYVDAETGQRGYLLTGDESYLAPYHAAVKQLSESNIRLKSLLAPMDQLEQLRSRMEAVGNEKLMELAQTIELRRDKGMDAALQVVLDHSGKTSMDQIRALAALIDSDQKSVMTVLLKDAEKRKTHAEIMSVSASAVLAAALCWLFFMTRLNIAERARLLASEHAANESLQRALAAERAAHSEAAHANKLKDEFLAVVSHELRTPLNAIVGWTSLLRDGSDHEELKEGLATIEKNAHAQARLVDDLLDISRIISGKLHLQITAMDLAKVASSVMDGLRPAADARGVSVTLHAADVSTEVAGDADRLQQIVWNLLSNAIKFTPRGGSVNISLFHESSDVALEVRDTGQGIKSSFLPHIFDRFSQQDATTTRKQEGLGLGLSITRHLAELHGGKIIATSDGEGKGATFRLQIPVMAVHETGATDQVHDAVHAKPESKASDSPPKSVRNLRILAVDDQSDALAVVSRVLTRAGAEVRTAESVEAALMILEGWRPHLIISDIGMPEQDGYTFIRVLRNSSDSSLRKVPAIALTAFARESDRFRALGAGFNDHLTKPVQARTLIEKAAEIAGRS